TLVVDPTEYKKGVGRSFVDYYEQMARDMECTVLRMDTNERNNRARRLYKRLGYREAGIVPCVFNGIPDVMLVCLEKKL
ncbi:MAG: GNAT family N-acetyltransferase, partial [Oscillospiraceae bacterium]|nr:GNAT family N-acetyltransferase [Oscillospiraceae bacterium]